MVDNNSPVFGGGKLIIAGMVIVIIVLGFALVILTIGQASNTALEYDRPVNALTQSNDECVVCHWEETPGIVNQYGISTMAGAEVTCQDCHQVDQNYAGAVEHEGTHILTSPTTAKCEKCHSQEVAEYNLSRHGIPAYVAVAGAQELSAAHLALYEAIPEGTFAPNKSRNAIAELEGPDLVRFTCYGCHNIGKPALDGSVGQCQKCHLRHTFSLEQARKPETCNACHIGPDHPQYEIYIESPHGISYLTGGDHWNWEAEPGTLTTTDFPAATCAICHMSGFGTSPTTHDVGDRLTWYLFAPISTRRPDWEENMGQMLGVCLACHNQNFIDDFYPAADKATERVNEWVRESDQIMANLQDHGLLTDYPFDETIDYVYFNLWHHWGRTTKFGTWMQGPDYAQWHGAYEVLHDLTELGELAEERLEEAGIEP